MDNTILYVLLGVLVVIIGVGISMLFEGRNNGASSENTDAGNLPHWLNDLNDESESPSDELYIGDKAFQCQLPGYSPYEAPPGNAASVVFP